MPLPSDPILAIDIGTHALRAAILVDGEIKVCERRDYELDVIDSRRIEQDADNIVDQLKDAIEVVLKQFEFSPVMAGIAIQRSTVVAWDSVSGKSVHPALSWQDTRAFDVVEGLADHKDEVKALSGLVLSPHYGASKIAWLGKFVDSGSNIKIAPLISFILFHLVKGKPFICDESNAGRTQLLDVNNRCWSSELCQLFEVDENSLPELKSVFSAYGKLTFADIPLVAVCGDQNAAFNYIQSFWRDEHKQCAAVNVGSGAFILKTLSENDNKEKFLKSVFNSDTQEVQYLLEGTVNGAGISIDAIKKQWLKESRLGEREFYQNIPLWWQKFSDVPLYLNVDGGLGSPFWRAGLESKFLADRQGGDGINIEQKVIAVVESTLFLIAINLEQLNSEIEALYVSGGVTMIESYCQQLANVTGCTVHRVDEPEATLMGVGLLCNKGQTGVKSDKNVTYLPQENLSLKDRFQYFKKELQVALQRSN